MSEFTRLPMPTGPYQVAVTPFDLIDQNRKSLEFPNGRLVPIWVYFPSKLGPQISYPKVIEERAKDDFDVISVWKSLKIEVFSKREIDLLSLKNFDSLPVVFLSHGNGCLLSDWGFIAENLASHGYIVISIQHQMKNDMKAPLAFKDRSFGPDVLVIDNLLFVFDYLKKKNKEQFYDVLDLKRIGCIGYSMGANALVLFASTGYRYPDKTLFPHESKEGVRECIIALDPQRFPFPTHNHYPIFLAYSEKRESEQRASGEYDFIRALGLSSVYYKKTNHGSFSDHAYLNIVSPSDPTFQWFEGSTEERMKFFDNLRQDILVFLKEKIGEPFR